MPRMLWTTLLLALAVALPAAAEETAGIRWEADLAAGIARAAREGRPILFAMNALESESANQRLQSELYPSPAWGEATREYVCFVCNGGTHGAGEECTRYPGIGCAVHQDALRYVIRRFAPADGALISPQHVILEPDGSVAWRKEYYTGVVRPELLETFWTRISPELAYERAGALRQDWIETLETGPLDQTTASARSWLRTGDPLAVAGILRAIDFSLEDKRRRNLLAALDATPSSQLAVVGLLADEAGARPDDRPDEALALANALLAVDRMSGVRLLARIAARTKNVALRTKAIDRWLEDRNGGGGIAPGDLPAEERAALAEVILLTGSGEPPEVDTDTIPPALVRRLARAQVAAGRRARRHPPLEEALEDGAAGVLRGALLEAAPDEVRRHAPAVRAALRERPEARVCYAAAIALLGAGLDEGGKVAPTIWAAIQDPVEGREARAEAVERLGMDPGWNQEVWSEALRKAMGGSK